MIPLCVDGFEDKSSDQKCLNHTKKHLHKTRDSLVAPSVLFGRLIWTLRAFIRILRALSWGSAGAHSGLFGCSSGTLQALIRDSSAAHSGLLGRSLALSGGLIRNPSGAHWAPFGRRFGFLYFSTFRCSTLGPLPKTKHTHAHTHTASGTTPGMQSSNGSPLGVCVLHMCLEQVQANLSLLRAVCHWFLQQQSFFMTSIGYPTRTYIAHSNVFVSIAKGDALQVLQQHITIRHADRRAGRAGRQHVPLGRT